MTAYEGDHFLQAGFSFPIRMSDLDYFRLADNPGVGPSMTTTALNATNKGFGFPL